MVYGNITIAFCFIYEDFITSRGGGAGESKCTLPFRVALNYCIAQIMKISIIYFRKSFIMPVLKRE